MFEDQTVDLLPERTTMGFFRVSGGNTAVGSFNGNGNGNTLQGGALNFSLLNGNGNGNFNGNGNIVVANGNVVG
jgi:hypothetical protein